MTNTTQMPDDNRAIIGRDAADMDNATIYRLARAQEHIRELETEARSARLQAPIANGSSRWSAVRAGVAGLFRVGRSVAPVAAPSHPSRPASAPHAIRRTAAGDHRDKVSGCPPVCDSAGNRAA